MDIQRFLDQPIPPLGAFDSDYDCGEAMECGEAVVDITEIHPRIKFDASYLKAGIPGALTRCYVRSGVYDRLCMALDMLPEEYSFLIYDTLRPLRVQKALFDDYYAHLEKQYPNADAKQLETLTREFVALPVLNITRPSSHQTGGAVDLTLMKNGQPVDMGTVFDEFEEIAHSDYFEREGAEESVRLNRRLLYNVMKAAGFTNYDCEWWHYDWGNRSWARINRCTSIYCYSDSPDLK